MKSQLKRFYSRWVSEALKQEKAFEEEFSRVSRVTPQA